MTENKMPTPPQKPLSASQRLTEAEAGLSELYGIINQLIRDIALIKEALRLLDNKVGSIVQASARGEGINDDTIERIMIENNCDKLAQKVKGLVQQGFLVAEDSVSENAFVVGKETDPETGEVTNPRTQFALKSLESPEVQSKLLGAAVGTTLNLEDGKALFTVTESYRIQTPPAQEAQEALPEEQPVAETAANPS